MITLEQLALPLFPYRRQYRPLKDPACPCCKQPVTAENARLMVWQSFREWLYLNWNWAGLELLRLLAQPPEQGGPARLSLAEHPDLLWALMAEAGARELELSDCLAEILDGYFQGLFDAMKRRAKRLRLPDPARPACKFCAGDMCQDASGVWRCQRDPWHSFRISPELPPGYQGLWMGHRRTDPRNGLGPVPVWATA